MTDAALLDCSTVLQTAMLSWLDGVAAAGVHWGLKNDRQLPRLEVFPSAAGTTKRYIGGATQWDGPLVVRATATTREDAHELLTNATAQLPRSAVVDGYTITLQSIRPLLGPSNGNTVGMVYQASVRPGG